MKKETETEFKVDFVGVGAPRCGTSWLSACLTEHPEICFSSPKETRFFDLPYNYKRGLSYYASFFKCKEGERVYGEFTPTYFLHEDIGQKLMTHFPDVKVLVMLRDPVARAISNIQYSARRSGEMHDVDTLSRDPDHYLITPGFYHAHLTRFLAPVPDEQVHVIIYEEITAEPERIMRDVFAFLEVESQYVPSLLHQSRNAASNESFWFPRFHMLIDRRKQIRRTVFGDYAVRFLKAIGVNALIKWLLRQNARLGHNRPDPITFSPEQKECLRALYAEDTKKLQNYLDRDLTEWWKTARTEHL